MYTTELQPQFRKLYEDVSCNLCGSPDYTVIYPAQYDEAHLEEIVTSSRSSGDEILVDRLVRCRQCGLQYLTPRLKPEISLQGYRSAEDEVFISQVAARERTFRKSLNLIERHVPHRGKILDIGTGGGSFLKVAQERGWEVVGCEPNSWLCQWAKDFYGLTLEHGTVFDMKLPDQSFDVVTLWDVLEHTSDPRSVLQECRRILKPGGLLVVHYPDIGSWIAKLMGRRWVYLLSVHLYYFTLETVYQMLDQTGFKVFHYQKYWQMLELDYILFRIERNIPVLPLLLRSLFRVIKLSHVGIPYWMGQSLVLAR